MMQPFSECRVATHPRLPVAILLRLGIVLSLSLSSTIDAEAAISVRNSSPSPNTHIGRVAATPGPTGFLCERYLYRPNIHASTGLTSAGQIRGNIEARWEATQFPVRDAKPFIAGKTKFVRVSGSSNWYPSDRKSPYFDWSDGVLMLGMEAGPVLWGRARPIRLFATTADGRRIAEDRLFSMDSTYGRRFGRHGSQYGMIGLRWRDVAKLGLADSGIRLVMTVMGEAAPRTYFVDPQLLRPIPGAVARLVAKVRADAADYKRRCKPFDPPHIVD